MFLGYGLTTEKAIIAQSYGLVLIEGFIPSFLDMLESVLFHRALPSFPLYLLRSFSNAFLRRFLGYLGW